MAFTVIYDANVLYPNSLRDLLIRIAQAGLVQAKWTSEILDETLGSLRRNRPDITQDKISRLRDLMNAAVRDCWIRAANRRAQAARRQRPSRAGGSDQG
jgi:hypothetical protein